MRDRIGDIDRKADALLEGVSADTKGFVDAKLRDLGIERRKLQNRSDELAAAPYEPIDADAILRDGLASLRDLPRLLESGNLEERKEFVRAFISGVTVRPDEARLDLVVSQLPSLNANSSLGLVAGARYVPLQIEMRPLETYLAGLRRAAWRHPSTSAATGGRTCVHGYEKRARAVNFRCRGSFLRRVRCPTETLP